MSHYHQPGWGLPNGHIVRSHMEAAVCDYLTAAMEPHVHGAYETLNFTVSIGPHRRALFVPSIVLTHTRHTQRSILIEPIDSVQPGGGARRLQGFCRQHGHEYCLIVIARRVLHHALPDNAYHLLLPLEDFIAPLDEFLRAASAG